jgi:GT2 family glycosyltransferase
MRRYQEVKTSVIIVTVERPECVRRCLECLHAQEPHPDQIVVVDASVDDLTKDVVERSPGVLYVRNPAGKGCTPRSRNLGLENAAGDIILYVDDDAYAHPGWLAAMLSAYTDDSIGGVGGRALRLKPGEEFEGVNEIGKIRPNGTITGNFAADPGKIIEVDHFIGANMSFRADVLARLGALNEEYAGGPECEETDIALRVKRLGYKLVFNPAAVVDHIAAPRVIGRRFGYRYWFFSHRNQLIFLMRHFGPFSPTPYRYLMTKVPGELAKPFVQFAQGALSAGLICCATVHGLFRGLTVCLLGGRNPVRNDPASVRLREHLTKGLSQKPLPQAGKAGDKRDEPAAALQARSEKPQT